MRILSLITKLRTLHDGRKTFLLKCLAVQSFSQQHRTLSWPLKSIPVTCQEFMSDSLKPAGFTFNVTLLATKGHGKHSTALVVHDNPGDSTSFTKLIDKLDHEGFEVLAPSLPGFGGSCGPDSSDLTHYTYSPSENAEFLERLLDTLQVSRVDILLGLGAGCGPATILATILATKFRSICLIDPTPPLDAFWPPRAPQLNRVPRPLRFLIPRLWPTNKPIFHSLLLKSLLRYVDRDDFPGLSARVCWPQVAVAALITQENSDLVVYYQRAVILASYSSLPLAIVTTTPNVTATQRTGLEDIFALVPDNWTEMKNVEDAVRVTASMLPRKWAVNVVTSSKDIVNDDTVAAILAKIISLRTESSVDNAENLCHGVG